MNLCLGGSLAQGFYLISNCSLGATLACAQNLFLALTSDITPGGTRGNLYVGPGIELRFAVCKASALPLYYLS